MSQDSKARKGSRDTQPMTRAEVSTRSRVQPSDERYLRMRATLASIADAVLCIDAAGVVDYLNPAAEELTGWKLADAESRPLGEVLPLVDERDGGGVLLDLAACLRQGGKLYLAQHYTLVRQGGQHLAIEGSMSAIYGPEGGVLGAVLVFQDVSQKRLLALRLTRAARYDGLTGLLNREAFEHHLQRALDEVRGGDQQHTLCFLDLDRFKVVNDTCGHSAGDQLLQWIASLIREQVRDTDVFARLGGDEFGLLLPNCGLEGAHRIAEGIHDALREFRFVWEQERFRIGASIGLVEVDNQFKDLAELLGAADQACYTAKQKGRRRTHVFRRDDAELQQQQGQMGWVVRLQRALDEDLFQLYWQPILPLANSGKQRLFFEVLLRLQDREGAPQSAGHFLPTAERYGLAPAIDCWVVRRTFQLLRGQSPEFLRALGFCSINLSGASLGEPAVLQVIEEELSHNTVPADRICFEITETAAVQHLEPALDMIERLRARRCRWALDDFGSGMSSYNYLKKLPVQFLKIDGNIVSDLVNSDLSREMVRSIHQIGHLMRLKTIGESVTSGAVLHALKEIGVDFAQGYGIERPRPILPQEPVPAHLGRRDSAAPS